MGIIQNIQNKSQAQKISLMWAIAITVAIIMIILWIVAYQFNKKREAEVFNTIGDQIKNEQQYYEKDLKTKGADVSDKYKFFKK